MYDVCSVVRVVHQVALVSLYNILQFGYQNLIHVRSKYYNIPLKFYTGVLRDIQFWLIKRSHGILLTQLHKLTEKIINDSRLPGLSTSDSTH